MIPHRFAEKLGIDYGFHLLAPFPGTTLREEQEKYDIEILTDDWDLYDANVPIVRTSHMSETYVADFMKKHNARQSDIWDRKVKRFEEGTCTSYEYLHVSGHNRMNLVFKLLSTDLIERYGVFNNGDSSVQMLAQRITQQTGDRPKLVKDTLAAAKRGRLYQDQCPAHQQHAGAGPITTVRTRNIDLYLVVFPFGTGTAGSGLV